MTAYKTATADALENATIEERFFTETHTIHFEYATTNEVMRIVKEFDLPVISQQFELSCQMTLEIKESLLPQVLPKLADCGKVEQNA